MHRNKLYISSLALFFAFSTFAQINADIQKKSESGLKSELNIDTKIDLYPNPAVDYLIIELNNSSLQNVQFEIRSMIGNMMIIKPETLSAQKYRIDLKEFASGYYFLIVRDDFVRFKKAYKFLKN